MGLAGQEEGFIPHEGDTKQTFVGRTVYKKVSIFLADCSLQISGIGQGEEDDIGVG